MQTIKQRHRKGPHNGFQLNQVTSIWGRVLENLFTLILDYNLTKHFISFVENVSKSIFG